MYTIFELQQLARQLVSAMILSGPENEQELHTLQALLDVEEGDDLNIFVADAKQYIAEAYTKFNDLINDLDEEVR